MSNYAFDAKEYGIFTPDGKLAIDPAEVKAHNEKIEQEELAVWATQPDRWQVYVGKHERGADVTTWLGTKLGTIVRVSQFRSNISRNLVALTIKGTNGAIYYGRYGADWSQLCRVRKSKRN